MFGKNFHRTLIYLLGHGSRPNVSPQRSRKYIPLTDDLAPGKPVGKNFLSVTAPDDECRSLYTARQARDNYTSKILYLKKSEP